jgi:hypothetical protein
MIESKAPVTAEQNRNARHLRRCFRVFGWGGPAVQDSAGSRLTHRRVDSLQRFAENLWIAEGPSVRFFGMLYPTRMVVVRLGDGSLWINSPVAATREEAGQLEHIGPISHLVCQRACTIGA